MIILVIIMKRKKFRKMCFFILIISIILIAILYLNNKKLGIDKINNSDNTTKEKSKNDIKEAKLTIVGDFLFESPFYDAINAGDDRDEYFSLVKDYFQNDDLSIGNMEVVIGNDNLKVSGTGFNFCAPEWVGKLMTTLNMEVLSTANNHANDRGYDGVKSSINFFKNNSDIMTLGTNELEENVNKVHIKEVNGIKFGFIAYTYGTNQKLSNDKLYTVNLYRKEDTLEIDKERIKKDVDNIKDQVDVIIAIVHFGIEFTNAPNNEQIELANYLNSLGVDILVGSHSHSIQPIKWIGDEHKTLVYYSLGNFVSADDDISRTGEKFDNAYQFGLLSTLKVTKNNNKININDVETIPIVNYFNKDMRNFKLIPIDKYNKDYETTHYRYQYNFNKDFILNMYNEVIDEEFR